MTSVLPERALKFLRLALNKAAQEGEWKAAAVKLVGALREQGMTPEQFEEAMPEPEDDWKSAPSSWVNVREVFEQMARENMRQKQERYQKAYQKNEDGPAFRNVVMPFGSYQGKMLRTIPLSELAWILRSLNSTPTSYGNVDALKDALFKEINFRTTKGGGR